MALDGGFQEEWALSGAQKGTGPGNGEGERGSRSPTLLLSALLTAQGKPQPTAKLVPLLPAPLKSISHSSTIVCRYFVPAKPPHGKFPQVKNITNFYFSGRKIVHFWALKLIPNLNTMKMDQLPKQWALVSWQNKGGFPSSMTLQYELGFCCY